MRVLAAASRFILSTPYHRVFIAGAFAAAFIPLLLIPSPAIPKSAHCSKPPIVPRAFWSAKPAIENRMRTQNPKSIVIHHTGVPAHPHVRLEKKLQDLQRYSQRPGSEEGRPKRALGDIPYHFFIGYSGRIGEGRGLEFAGDTRTNYDTADKIQIVVEGEFMSERPQAKQLAALESLVCWLRSKFAVPVSRIKAHQDVASTSCPGKNLLEILPRLKFAK